ATNHLTVSSVSANRLLVTLTGTSSRLSSALQTGFERFHSAADGNFFAASKAAHLPASFASSVSSVVGLSSLAKVALPTPSVRSASALSSGKSALSTVALPTLNYPATYTPQQLNAM